MFVSQSDHEAQLQALKTLLAQRDRTITELQRQKTLDDDRARKLQDSLDVVAASVKPAKRRPYEYRPCDAYLLRVIYSEQLTDEQNEVFSRFEARTLNPPAFLTEFEWGFYTPEELWVMNVEMMQTIADNLRTLKFPATPKTNR